MEAYDISDMKKVRVHLEDTFFFEVTLQTSNLSTVQDPNMTIPADFIEEYGVFFNDERPVEGRAVLQSVESEKKWVVESEVCWSITGAPVVKFRQGWRAFAAGMGLAEGDVLLFSLKPKSKFDFEVYNFRGKRQSPSSPRAPPRECSDEQPRKKEQSTEKVTKLKKATGSVCDATSSRSSPWFVKRLGHCHVRALEVPQAFVTAHGELFRSEDAVVKLAGVREGLPVRTVGCKWYDRSQRPRGARVYFAAGWSDFVQENGLKSGQTLKFTLTANSFFVVEEIPTP